MPTINEGELAGSPPPDCTQCDEFEGSIWLCGEGYLCERCFSKLAGIEESEIYSAEPGLDFDIQPEHTAKVKASLMNSRESVDGED